MQEIPEPEEKESDRGKISGNPRCLPCTRSEDAGVRQGAFPVPPPPVLNPGKIPATPVLKTGYFARDGRKPGAVSIARFPPGWYSGPRCFRLAPPPDLLKERDWDEYCRRYRREVLDRLDPDEVIRELERLAGSTDIILLCSEKDRSHCHRGLVAEWFCETRGIRIPETGNEGQQTL